MSSLRRAVLPGFGSARKTPQSFLMQKVKKHEPPESSSLGLFDILVSGLTGQMLAAPSLCSCVLTVFIGVQC